MLLGVLEGGDAALVYSGEIDEEHVHTTRSTVRLLGGALNVYVRCISFKERGCYL